MKVEVGVQFSSISLKSAVWKLTRVPKVPRVYTERRRVSITCNGLKVTASLPRRRKIASLNYLPASHLWRQDHNGFTHQDPGFIDTAGFPPGR